MRQYVVELDPSLGQREIEKTLRAIQMVPGVTRVTYFDTNDSAPVIDEEAGEDEVKVLEPDMLIPGKPVYAPPAYMTRQHCIYEWYDHATDEVRYIGTTSTHIEQRTKGHLREAFKERAFYDWLREQFDAGTLPGVREVDLAPNRPEAELKEQQHIQDAIRAGHRLFNKEAGSNASLMFYRMLISRAPR